MSILTARPGADQERFDMESLVEKGILAMTPRPWSADAPDDLAYVSALFSRQAPGASVLGLYRVENGGLGKVYRAVKGTMECQQERLLWHGTSAKCARNVVLHGFNRAYSGRHGTKLGQGSYFSSEAGYSTRFCDSRQTRRVMLLAMVMVGAWTKGSPELVEPPYRDKDELVRYDSVVDNADAPSCFCVFRDFQALPLFLVEFCGPAP